MSAEATLPAVTKNRRELTLERSGRSGKFKISNYIGRAFSLQPRADSPIDPMITFEELLVLSMFFSTRCGWSVTRWMRSKGIHHKKVSSSISDTQVIEREVSSRVCFLELPWRRSDSQGYGRTDRQKDTAAAAARQKTKMSRENIFKLCASAEQTKHFG